MKEFTIIFLISVLILVPGCLETQREVVNVYVCADGSLASNADDCEISEEECPEPEIIEITKYVCAGGEIVSEADDCVIASTSLPEAVSSTTVQETTTLEELGTTIAEETSSTVESASTIEDDCQFVGSVNSDKYHYPDCRYAKRINEENLVCFADEDEAQEEDYIPCGVCEPPG